MVLSLLTKNIIGPHLPFVAFSGSLLEWTTTEAKAHDVGGYGHMYSLVHWRCLRQNGELNNIYARTERN